MERLSYLPKSGGYIGVVVAYTEKDSELKFIRKETMRTVQNLITDSGYDKKNSQQVSSTHRKYASTADHNIP